MPAILLTVLACQPPIAVVDSGPGEDTRPQPQPQLVLPADVLIEDAPLGTNTAVTVALSNSGDADVQLVELRSDSERWQVGHLASATIPPGGQASFELSVTPQDLELHSAVITIVTQTGEFQLGAAAIPSGPWLRLETEAPASLELGCGGSMSWSVHNDGTQPTVISEVRISGPWIQALSNPELPVTLGPGEALEGRADWQTPSDDSAQETRLQVLHEGFPELDESWSHSVSASWASETLEVVESRDVDLIWTLDHSGQGPNKGAEILEDLHLLFDTLDAAGMRWQLTPVITDDGCMLSAPSTDTQTQERALQLAAENFCLDGPIWACTAYGAKTEMGFAQVMAAVAESGSGGCNAGMLREGAVLHVLGTSDEPEQSGTSAADYLAELEKSADRVQAHAIAGPLDGSCASTAGGAGYYQSTVLSGGLFADWCQETAVSVQQIADRIVETSLDLQTPLAHPPVPESFEARLGGVLVEVTLDASAPSFTPPEPGTWTLDYAIQPECE